MARLILNLDNQVLAEYNMMKERYTIGRLPDNDVRIDNPTVSGHHSLIINILNDSFLEDLNSTNGTYVNGKLIKKHALQHGDVITVGRHQLRFVDNTADGEEQDDFAQTMVLSKSDMPSSLPAVAASQDSSAQAPQRQAPPSVAKIQVLNGTFAGREVQLNKALTTMGQPGVQVIAITRRGDGYHLVQVENAPGREPPKVNGQPVGQQARRLSDNDVIELVGIKMGFFLD
ncbi:MAG: FHA domain-containing protein [Gammaproteobacteria bacterium]|nr:MAG: FHA domain-containing protein [Gammaproteobacteria bacterium]